MKQVLLFFANVTVIGFDCFECFALLHISAIIRMEGNGAKGSNNAYKEDPGKVNLCFIEQGSGGDMLAVQAQNGN